MGNGAGLTMVQKVRRMNLKRLVAKFFKGNASEAGRQLGSSHTYMWQILSGHRGIGERSAREIEERLKLPKYALDANLKRTIEVPVQLGGGRSEVYHMVPLRSITKLDEDPSGFRICPVVDLPPEAFAVTVDADNQAAMSEVGEGDVLFIRPAKKKDELLPRKLYLVRLKGKPGGRVLMVRASGDGLVFHATQTKRDYPLEDFMVLGRVALIIRELR